MLGMQDERRTRDIRFDVPSLDRLNNECFDEENKLFECYRFQKSWRIARTSSAQFGTKRR